MTIGAAVECCGLRCREVADTGSGCRAIAIKENSLTQILTGELRFLHTGHVRAHEIGKGAPLGDVVRFATKSFVLIREAGQKRLHKSNFAVW